MQEAWLNSPDFHKTSSESNGCILHAWARLRPTTEPGLKDFSSAKGPEGRHHPEIRVQKRKHTAHCNCSTATAIWFVARSPTAVGSRHFSGGRTLSAFSELLPGKERLRAMLDLGQLDQCLSFFWLSFILNWGPCRWCVRGTMRMWQFFCQSYCKRIEMEQTDQYHCTKNKNMSQQAAPRKYCAKEWNNPMSKPVLQKKNSLCPGHVGPQRLSQLAKQESAVERNGRIFEINHTHLQSLTRNLKNDQWLTLVQRLIHTQQATFELFTFEVLRYWNFQSLLFLLTTSANPSSTMLTKHIKMKHQEQSVRRSSSDGLWEGSAPSSLEQMCKTRQRRLRQLWKCYVETWNPLSKIWFRVWAKNVCADPHRSAASALLMKSAKKSLPVPWRHEANCKKGRMSLMKDWCFGGCIVFLYPLPWDTPP